MTKRLILFASLIAFAAIAHSCTGEAHRGVAGKIISCTDSTLTLSANNGDTLQFVINRNAIGNDIVVPDDSIAISYTDSCGVRLANDIVVICHNNPFINNKSALLVGKWGLVYQYTDGSQREYTIQFNVDSTFETHIPAAADYHTWVLSGDSVLFQRLDTGSNSKSILSYKLIRVDIDSLTFINSDTIVSFTRYR